MIAICVTPRHLSHGKGIHAADGLLLLLLLLLLLFYATSTIGCCRRRRGIQHHDKDVFVIGTQVNAGDNDKGTATVQSIDFVIPSFKVAGRTRTRTCCC